jgi:hypothetical protein
LWAELILDGRIFGGGSGVRITSSQGSFASDGAALSAGADLVEVVTGPTVHAAAVAEFFIPEFSAAAIAGSFAFAGELDVDAMAPVAGLADTAILGNEFHLGWRTLF